MDSHQSSLEQEHIWVQAAQKNTRHFRPLYEKYIDSVYRFFVRRTDNPSLAEELCSTTFFKALDKLATFQWQGKPFGAWLFTIAKNELRKYYRDQRPIYVIEEDKIECLIVEESICEYLPAMIRILEDLPESDLQILELKFFEGKSFKDISSLLGIGESAAKMRTYRLLERLKSQLKDHNHDQKRL